MFFVQQVFVTEDLTKISACFLHACNSYHGAYSEPTGSSAIEAGGDNAAYAASGVLVSSGIAVGRASSPSKSYLAYSSCGSSHGGRLQQQDMLLREKLSARITLLKRCTLVIQCSCCIRPHAALSVSLIDTALYCFSTRSSFGKWVYRDRTHHIRRRSLS